MSLLMHCPGDLSRCAVTVHYCWEVSRCGSAVLQHDVLLRGTVVMYYRGAFHNVSWCGALAPRLYAAILSAAMGYIAIYTVQLLTCT